MTQDSRPQFVVLPSGAIVNIENISHMVGQMNEWVLIPKRSIAPQVPKMDGLDKDGLVAKLLELGIAVQVVRAESPAANDEKPKLVTA